MPLSFINPSRSFDPRRSSIRFVGHDGLKQILFLLPVALFHQEGVSPNRLERDYLLAFDRFKGRIFETAIAAYKRKRETMIELDRKALGSSLTLSA
ncbi:DUF1488 family protein [Rhizobium sp. YIM 134829]|uniref:DUF1488 family protein n=1 Tax=Rhizobium sp. YIM 134829 TaxID=3390453 RepID=UPI00397B1AB9